MKKNVLLFLCIIFGAIIFPIRTSATNTPCAELILGHNEETADRIDILFYNFAYADQATFVDTLRSIVQNGFMSIEPTASNKNLFNFWYVNRDELPKRNILEQITKEVHDMCPQLNYSAKTFEVMYVNNQQQQGMPPGASTFGHGSTIILIEPKRTRGYSTQMLFHHSYLLLHELVGHAIGELVDEYTLSSDKSQEHSAIVSNGINCFVGTYEQCLSDSPWSDLIGQGCGNPDSIDCDETDPDKYKEVDCYEGCRLLTSGAFRPHDTSIMNEQRKDFFGLAQAREICNKIQKYTGKASGYCFTALGIGIADPNYVESNNTQAENNTAQDPPVQNTPPEIFIDREPAQHNATQIINIIGITFLSIILAGGCITCLWYLVKLAHKK
ncbi:MAG: hypothetical protein HYV41_03290 [Candidatus Magasanikbacteria bacterium]|nr:hypothetical protein [Candidatus Magasanikbacteria bacterium]